MTLSIVIPAHQAASYLSTSLTAVFASDVTAIEVIVVDDGSTDGTAEIAREAGARVVATPAGPSGPAAARNLGAAVASGEVLVFLDADVAVHSRTLSQFERCLASHPDVAAVFGSYDDRPPSAGLVSQYRNLLHHFVHQQGRREASTFWAGCGAVRRAIFVEAGGFDERYRRASIEDIELGGRLRASGHRVWLEPEIQCAHLKRWTFWQMVRSDIFDRAIPWSRLILKSGRLPSDLNTSMQSRLAALAAWAAIGSLVLSIVWPVALAASAAALAATVLLNARLYGFFRRKRGLRFAAGAACLHVLYLLYSSAVFAGLFASARLRTGRVAPSPPQPSSRQAS